MNRYTIKLQKEEVEELLAIINKGSHSSHTFRTAYVLLNCDEGEHADKVTNEQISRILKIGMRTIVEWTMNTSGTGWSTSLWPMNR